MLKKLINWIRTVLGVFIPGLKRTPEELLEEERGELKRQLESFNQGLAAHARLSARLMSQAQDLQEEEQRLREKIRQRLKNSERDQAASSALKLRAVVARLEDHRARLEEAEQTYRSLIQARDSAVRAVRLRIERLEQGLDDLKVRRVTAELTELASDSLSGAGDDTLTRLQEMVEQERGKAVGRARVASFSLELTEAGTRAPDERAMAEQALADFASAEGMELGPDPGRRRSSDRERE